MCKGMSMTLHYKATKQWFQGKTSHDQRQVVTSRSGGVSRMTWQWCQVRNFLEMVVQVAAKVMVWVVEQDWYSARLNKWSVCINFGGSSHRWPRHGLVSGLEEMVTWCGDGGGGYGGGGARAAPWKVAGKCKNQTTSRKKWKKNMKVYQIFFVQMETKNFEVRSVSIREKWIRMQLKEWDRVGYQWMQEF